MNTDNMLLSGETIDYGPCAFMDGYDPGAVFSSIDQGGRYAYRNQPHIAHWNLSVLAQALLPLLDDDREKAMASGQVAIDAFPDLYLGAYQNGMRKKLGLTQGRADDNVYFQDLSTLMQEEKTDFTLTFRHLSDLADPGGASGGGVGSIFELPDTFTPWLDWWQKRLSSESQDARGRQTGMYAVNPAFIARNHLVEEAINAAVHQQDFKPFHALIDVLAQPFEFNDAQAHYAMPPRPEQVVKQTFCGT
jgi:uncharacterized protein YdiU (UPF0061 family)